MHLCVYTYRSTVLINIQLFYRYEYRWADGEKIKKPIEVSAPKYVELLMDWIEGQLDNESIFPQRLGNICCQIRILSQFFSSFSYNLWSAKTFVGAPFPPNFKDVVKTIFKRLFRVYAHIYHSHFQKIVSLKEEAHLNTCFKHFILFTCVSLPYLSDLFFSKKKIQGLRSSNLVDFMYGFSIHRTSAWS